jgi:hypothetical protein
MHPAPDIHTSPLSLDRKDYAGLGIVALATILFCLFANRPSQLYFFGDTWDILCEFHERGWRTMGLMHNEHFIPVSKAVLYLQYLLFGMNNFRYQVVSIVIHATNAALLYLVARELTPFAVPRIFGALFFAFSGVYWEVTMWETGQVMSLAVLFIFLSLILGGRYLRSGETVVLALTMLTSLLASWSVGLGLLVVPLLIAHAAVSYPRRRKAMIAICVLPAVTILFGMVVALWSDPGGMAFAGRQASVKQALQVIPWTATGLRFLTSSYYPPFCAPLALGGIFLLTGLLFPRRFASKRRLLALLVPLLMLLLPYVLTGLGRAQLGIGFAASSRYQYLPAAALGLILAWTAGGAFRIVKNRYPKALGPLTLLVLATLPVHAIVGYVYLGGHSPAIGWGQSAHRFANLAIYGSDCTCTPAGMACVRPALYLPNGMYPFPFFDLARALPLYAGSVVRTAACPVTITSVLNNKEIAPGNLLNGGERGIVPGKWTGYGAAIASFAVPGPGVPRVARIELQGISGYSFVVRAANADHPYSFAASVQLVSGDPGPSMRIAFKDLAGSPLETFVSHPISSHDFTTLAVSAYPTPGTASITVEFAGAAPASEFSVITVRDAVLVEHPIYIRAADIPAATSAVRSSPQTSRQFPMSRSYALRRAAYIPAAH